MSSTPPPRQNQPTPVAALTAAFDRDHLRAALGALEHEMRQSFAREEAPAGLFAFVAHAAPRYLGFIDSLRHEHRELLSRIASLRHRATDGAEVDQLWREHTGLLLDLARHDELERAVLRDALEPCDLA
jgi:hypothetical protein